MELTWLVLLFDQNEVHGTLVLVKNKEGAWPLPLLGDARII